MDDSPPPRQRQTRSAAGEDGRSPTTQTPPSDASPSDVDEDALYEWDREPVREEGFKPGRYFAGLMAGEHVAGTEFVIGTLFVLSGAEFWDLIGGLLLGNLLAVLSWAFLCAPIATDVRLTLYWYLRKIAGPRLTMVYNVVNAFLYCVLAGAMIAVATTAIGLAFGLPTPDLTAVMPPSLAWVLITLTIGGLFTLVAVLGFDQLSMFASVCSPWIFIVFVAGAIAMLPRLGVESDLSNLYEVATTQIWNGEVAEGRSKLGFWHMVFFAWIANLAMHVGLSDLALFRYAENWTYGFYSAIGMYTGHFLAWICSGVMVAAVAGEPNPGLMAYEAVGFAGAFAVLAAGWTTANPTLYRAGLALQAVTPDWARWKVTAATGALTAAVACFPVVFLRLLDFVAIYGLIIMPIGAIVFTEHWIVPALGAERYLPERRGRALNWKAALVWAATLAFCYLIFQLGMHQYFIWLPGYLFATAAYAGLKFAFDRGETGSDVRTESETARAV
jgi:purine-cytosine permease-like protein